VRKPRRPAAGPRGRQHHAATAARQDWRCCFDGRWAHDGSRAPAVDRARDGRGHAEQPEQRRQDCRASWGARWCPSRPGEVRCWTKRAAPRSVPGTGGRRQWRVVRPPHPALRAGLSPASGGEAVGGRRQWRLLRWPRAARERTGSRSAPATAEEPAAGRQTRVEPLGRCGDPPHRRMSGRNARPTRPDCPYRITCARRVSRSTCWATRRVARPIFSVSAGTVFATRSSMADAVRNVPRCDTSTGRPASRTSLRM